MGCFDPVAGILYWILSSANAGNVWKGFTAIDPISDMCVYPGKCYTPGCSTPDEGANSFTIVVNSLNRSFVLTPTTYGPFPCSWDGAPDPLGLVLGGDSLFFGSEAGDGGYRWHKSPLDPTAWPGPCPGTTTWGILATLGDDNWGGGTALQSRIAASWSPTLGLVHVGADGNVWTWGTSGIGGPFALPGSWGSGATAAACQAGNDVWVLGSDTSHNARLSKVGASGLTNYTLSLSGNANDIQYCAIDNTLLFWVGNVLYKWDIGTQTIVSSAAVVWLQSGPVNGGLIPNGLSLYDAVTLALSPLTAEYNNPTLPAGSPYPGLFPDFYDSVNQYIWLQGTDHNVWGAGVGPYGGPPSAPPPLRYKRLPLKLDFSSCSFDQADRLLMYELYRACGLDPLNPFLVALLPFLSGAIWQPPVTLRLTVWGESVDSAWNILKSGMSLSDTAPGPICGRVLTIDTVNYPEWNGDWEIVECEYVPFGGQASQTYGSQSGGEVTGNAEIISAPTQGAGMLTLTLRTYNPNVFFDSSMTPSWVDVPGPWADGSY
jgi:hypothetical protein